LGLIPRPVGRKLSLVFQAFLKSVQNTPSACSGDFFIFSGLTHTGVLKLTDRSWNSPESTHKHKERSWHQA